MSATTIVDDSTVSIPVFGRLTLGNFLDWLVTLCLGSIITLTTIKLGGVRPDTQFALLPLYWILLSLHGLWLAVDSSPNKLLSRIPLWFIPTILWILWSVLWVSPVKWLGWYEMIYALQAFIVFWVLCNNLRNRVHLWTILIIALISAGIAILNGFYQFFQNSNQISDANTAYPLELNTQFLGKATGTFADPNTFAVFLLSLLPLILIASLVRRFPKIIRVSSSYLVLVFLVAIAFTQTGWAALVSMFLLMLVPWLCIQRLSGKIIFSVLGLLISALPFISLFLFHAPFKENVQQTFSLKGLEVPSVLWGEALEMIRDHPLTGVGAGAYALSFQQSPDASLPEAPLTPHNDYLLGLSQFGLPGALLFAIPALIILRKAFKIWTRESYSIRLRDSDGELFPPGKFFLSFGLSGTLAIGLCMILTFVVYVPALMLYAVLVFTIPAKVSFVRSLRIPENLVSRIGYFIIFTGIGWLFYTFSGDKLEAHGLELRARQELKNIVDMRIHISGNTELLDDVILLFEKALLKDDKNVDAWIGLSSAVCQKYFDNPASFETIAVRAVECANQASELSPEYWMAWTQLGLAKSLQGELEAAERAFLKALELAPNNSHANYYYGAFLSFDSERKAEALDFAKKALKINPGHPAARRLEQKLLIL